MMKLGRLISVMLVMALCISVFSGCTGKKVSVISSSNGDSQNSGFDINSGMDETEATSKGQTHAGTTASGGTGAASGRVTDLKGRVIRINVQSTTNANTTQGKETLAWRKVIEQKYNCKFQEVAMMSETAGNTTITTSVLSGKPIVDLWFQNGAADIIPHYQAKLLQNLSALKVIDFDSKTSPYKENQSIFKFSGSYYGLVSANTPVADPWYSNVVFFNDKLLKKYGVSENLYTLQKNNQWTWDKFKELADKFNRNCTDPSITACFDDGAMLYNSLLYTRGVDWVSKINGVLKFNGNDKLAQTALTTYTKYVKDGIVKLGPKSANYGTAALTGAGIVDGADGKYSFIKGQAAFTIFPMLGMEWQINKNENATEEVKKNFGIVPLPKVKSTDGITVASSIMGQGGYCIPYGVKKPNEVATVLDALQQMPQDKTALSKLLFNSYVVNWLNNATGTGTKDIATQIINMTLDGKCMPTYSGLMQNTTPSLLKDKDGWSAHVYNIANGNEAMGSVLPAVTDKYNKIIADMYSQR